MKLDITNYSDEELSLIVFNDEILYLSRHNDNFFDLIDDEFIYTDEQKDVLIQDLSDDKDEE